MAGNASRYRGPVKYSANGRALGRPRRQPSADAAKRVEELAAQGLPKSAIALALNVNRHLFNRWLDEREDMAEALLRGREAERHALHNKLFEAAMKGKGRDALLAAMFLLKSRHGYIEGTEVDGGASRVTINFALPGATKPDQYTIENEPRSD